MSRHCAWLIQLIYIVVYVHGYHVRHSCQRVTLYMSRALHIHTHCLEMSSHTLRTGWVTKRGQINKNWKRRLAFISSHTFTCCSVHMHAFDDAMQWWWLRHVHSCNHHLFQPQWHAQVSCASVGLHAVLLPKRRHTAQAQGPLRCFYTDP